MAKQRIFALLFILLNSLLLINSERILGIFITPSISHLFIHLTIADELIQAGHEVTVLGSHPNPFKNSTYKYIDLSNGKPTSSAKAIQDLMYDKRPTIVHVHDVFQYANTATEKALNNPILKKFLVEHSAGSFDLLISGYFFNDYHIGLGGHFRCPIIVSWMLQMPSELSDLIGNPIEMSYVPNVQLGMRQPMSFLERVRNIFYEICRTFLVIYERHHALKIYERQFPADRYPSFEEVRNNISLVFVNHHFSQKPLRPLLPAIIEIGGIQVNENPDPLPKDLADIFEKSEKGVIYFGLGSNVESNMMREDRIRTLYNVFSQLPYTVIWKWTSKELPGSAKNIYFKDWLPQTSILAHPKLKLFITHAGGGGIVEAQFFAKPMLAMPLFGDQFTHAKNAVGNGFALMIDFHKFTEQSLKESIYKLVENPVYKKNIENFANIYKDRPLKPRESVRYWTNYVLRHNGAKHLQSPAVHMNFFQLHCLDVFAFLLLIIVLIIYMPFKICKYLYNNLTHHKQKVNNLKKKKTK